MIEIPDQQHWQAAVGYVEFGMFLGSRHAAIRISNADCSPLRINGRDPAATAAKREPQKISYYDGLRFADPDAHLPRRILEEAE
jgi:hypothetical protein